MKVPDIACRAEAYGIPGVAVDGNQVEAVYAVVGEAVERARAGGGPTLIEAKTMRMQGHAIHDGFEYVPRELLAYWEERDPATAVRPKAAERRRGRRRRAGRDPGTLRRGDCGRHWSLPRRARCRRPRL